MPKSKSPKRHRRRNERTSARKQTSSRVSTIAAHLLAKYRKLTHKGSLGADSPVIGTDRVKWAELAMLAASCLSQDESASALTQKTKGKRKGGKRRGRK